MITNNKSNYIYIIGAGFAGVSLSREIKEKDPKIEVAAFLDDDSAKIGTVVNNIPVLGPISAVAKLLNNSMGNEALIAIPSASNEQIAHIYKHLNKAGFTRIKILPGLSQLIDGKAHLIQTRELDLQDLLRRTPIALNLKKTLSYLRGKRVLITGAGGSIGSEISRQLLSGGAERLFLFGHGENSIYQIQKELNLLQSEGVGEKATVVPVIGDLHDRDYMNFILKRLRVDIIFHCAAHKHVPMMEFNPVEAIHNNVLGTRNLVEAAQNSGTKRFVLISTDKAVDPESIYGASKKIAETIVLQNNGKNCDYMVVRFGNVLGSRGSIVPLFKEQILNGGPVTVTDPKTSRFFMTIPEASALVLQAGGVGKGNDLYLLDMGEAVLIKEMALQMIAFYKNDPHSIPIKYIGMRPGEKIFENLYGKDEFVEKTDYQKILRVIKKNSLSFPIEDLIKEIEPICLFNENNKEVYRNRHVLKKIISKYIPGIKVSKDEQEY